MFSPSYIAAQLGNWSFAGFSKNKRTFLAFSSVRIIESCYLSFIEIFSWENLFTTITLFVSSIRKEFSVFFSMKSIRKYLEILNRIIRCVFIFMMNMFIVFQKSSNILFHNMSMFINSSAIYSYAYISSFCSLAFSVSSTEARKRIAISPFSFVMNIAKGFTFTPSKTSFYRAQHGASLPDPNERDNIIFPILICPAV